MGEAAVHDLLAKISELSEADRLLLEQKLAERADAEWSREADAAAVSARDRGIDQAAIDRAVKEFRYPSRPDAR